MIQRGNSSYSFYIHEIVGRDKGQLDNAFMQTETDMYFIDIGYAVTHLQFMVRKIISSKISAV